MKIGFLKDGLAFNNKKFHPLNLSTKKHQIESDVTFNEFNPTELLQELSKLKNENLTKTSKMNTLSTILEKITS